MSQELTNARRALSKVSPDLKQGQLISAATSIRDAARLFGRVPMMRSEHEEFVSMLQSATQLMHYSEKVSKIFPLAITYTPGQEGELGDLMNQLIEALQESSTEEALKRHREHQAAQLAKGHQELKNGEFAEGKKTLDQLAEEYSGDGGLVAEIADLFMEANMLEDAARHLFLAVRLLPDSAHVLNRLGIVLRRLKRFDEAQIYFDRALGIEKNDSNLYFNVGRLYFDWNKWDQAVEYAAKALGLNPDFTEAGKLIAYIERERAKTGA